MRSNGPGQRIADVAHTPRITFVASTLIPASADAVFDWHEAPGAFQRLTSPAMLAVQCVAFASTDRLKDLSAWVAGLRQTYLRRHAFREEQMRAMEILRVSRLSDAAARQTWTADNAKPRGRTMRAISAHRILNTFSRVCPEFVDL